MAGAGGRGRVPVAGAGAGGRWPELVAAGAQWLCLSQPTRVELGHTMAPRSFGVVLGVASMLCCGCGAKGTETSLSAVRGKTVDLTVLGSRPPTASNMVDIALGFPDVWQDEGNACPIVHASATFGGVALTQKAHGGTVECGLSGDPMCGRMCLNVAWTSDSVGPLMSLPDPIDVVLQDASETAVATIPNPARAATVTVLDLIEGQEVKYGDSFYIQIQPQPPATVFDIKASLRVEAAGGGLSISFDQSGIWRVDIVGPSIPTGPLTVAFWNRTKLRFDACPSDFTCTGLSDVELSEFALQLSP